MDRVRHLSDEWIAAMDAALRAHAGTTDAAGPAIRIRTIVTDPVAGDTAYDVEVGGGEPGVRRVDPLEPVEPPASPARRPTTGAATATATATDAGPDAGTVTFRTDRATAGAIAAGRESAQAAFMAGRLRVDGDTRLLMAHQAVLGELDDLFAAVRAATDFDRAPAR